MIGRNYWWFNGIPITFSIVCLFERLTCNWTEKGKENFNFEILRKRVLKEREKKEKERERERERKKKKDDS